MALKLGLLIGFKISSFLSCTMSPIGKPHPKDKFTPSEDEKLRLLVQVLGTSNWKKVSEYMVTRNPRQCRDRYKNYLAPYLNNSPWCKDDDQKLISLVQNYGRKWSLIAKEFPGRTDINIKSRYALLVRQEERDKVKRVSQNDSDFLELIMHETPTSSPDFEDNLDMFEFGDLPEFEF